jgi:hypothetical protein
MLVLKTEKLKSMFLEFTAPKVAKNTIDILAKIQRKLRHEIDDTIRSLSNKQSSEVINQTEMRIVGLKRSGNHAITNWIIKQNTKKVFYINDVGVNENPYREKYESLLRLQDYRGRHRWEPEVQGNFRLKDCLIYSYEDYSLDRVTNPVFERKHDLYFGKSGKRYDLLILRDPFNCLASRIKSNMLSVKDNKIVINYNSWVDDLDYRRQISSQLKLEFSDAGFNEVKHQGGGSSFDGMQFTGQANKMNVHNRWQQFIDDPAFRQLLSNEELLDYSAKIFGHIVDKAELSLKNN